ncbi:putative ribonuclease H-like domain-containing protein, partial [Tanacetum coccineum]
ELPAKKNLGLFGGKASLDEAVNVAISGGSCKQHKATYKAITTVSSISEPLQLLHMDLFGPTSIRSIDHKYYCLVITDDYSSDHLGICDGKTEMGICWITCPVNRAYRVYNMANKRVEETMNLRFLEEKANIQGIGFQDDDSDSTVMKQELARLKDQEQRATSDAERLRLGFANSTSVFPRGVPSGIVQTISFYEAEPPTDFSSPSDLGKILLPAPVHPQSLIIGEPNSSIQTRSQVYKKTTGETAFLSYIQDQQRNNHTDFQHCLFALVSFFKLTKKVNLYCGLSGYQKQAEVAKGMVMDVKSVFLYRSIDEEVYVTQPKGFMDPQYPKKVYKVVKALYGLHQAPRAWYATLSTFLLKHGYRRGTIDKTLFLKKHKRDIILVQVYVDDIIFGSTKKAWCDEFEALMKGEFEMSAMGELIFFLGLQVQQRPDGIFIGQDKYVQEILKKFDLESVGLPTTPIEAPKLSSWPVLMFASIHVHGIKSLLLLRFESSEEIFIGKARSKQLWRPLLMSEYVAAANVVFGSDDYHQVLDFLRASHIRSPELGPSAILATIDETPYTITEDSVRSSLQLADDGGIDDLPIAEIYSEMDNLGYVTEGKLTFYKNKFSPQWRFLVHTILHCLSIKSGSWDQFGSSLAVALICLSIGRTFNWSSYIFKRMVSNIGNAKKFLMYPRFLQTILGIETSITREYHVFKLSSKLFANMKLNFEGQPMPLLAAMLPQVQEGEGAGVAAQVVPPPIPAPIPKPMPEPDQPQDHLLHPIQQTSGPFLPPYVEDEPFFYFCAKGNKKEGGLSDLTMKAGGEQAVDLDALIALANAAMTVDSNIPPGGASSNPAISSHIPTDVPIGGDFAPAHSTSPSRDPFKGKAAKFRSLKREISEKEKLKLQRQDAFMQSSWNKRLELSGSSRGRPDKQRHFKEQKVMTFPILSVPDVPQPPVVSSPKYSGTRRKSLGRSRITKPKSILIKLDLDADDKTFIKVVSDEDSKDAAPIFGLLCGVDRFSRGGKGSLVGKINILAIRIKLMEKMLKHKLEIDKDVVGNDMNTAEQLIQFIKNQLADAPKFLLLDLVLWSLNWPMFEVYLLVEMSLKSTWEQTLSGSQGFAIAHNAITVCGVGLVLISPGYVVPTGKDNFIVSAGRRNMVPAASNWLERLPAGSITTWEDLTTRFLAQFFPPERTAKLRNDILIFQQHHGESLSEAWTRFKDLLQKVPHHGIDCWLQIQNFYDHVSFHLKCEIDRTAGGKLHDKNADESWEIIENLALYDHEGWNDIKEFIKPVKAISTPQSTSKTPDRRLLELKD